MTAFDLVAGICGIAAFLVLCAQGASLIRTESHLLFTSDPARSLAMAKRACDDRGLTYSELAGIAAGLKVSGRAYKIRAVRHKGEREGWLSSVPVSRVETR